MNTQKHHITSWIVLWSNHIFNKCFFSYLKMFSTQCGKNIKAEDNKKTMNVANFINIYTNIYIPALYVMIMTQNKRFNKLNTAAWTSCWQKFLCSISYFRISIFDLVSQTVQMEGSNRLLSNKDQEQLKYLRMKISCC